MGLSLQLSDAGVGVERLVMANNRNVKRRAEGALRGDSELLINTHTHTGQAREKREVQ